MTHLPWFWQFFRHCRPKKVEHITRSLSKILMSTNEGLDPLIDESQSRYLFSEHGCLYVYQSKLNFEQARRSNQSRADNGVAFTELSTADIRDLEPGLVLDFARGLLFNNARQVLNPQHLVNRYFETFLSNQGSYENQHVSSVSDDSAGGTDCATLALSNGRTFKTGQVVIASGAFSGG